MPVIEKAKTLIWFAQRPSYWRHAVALARRKFGEDFDSPALQAEASQWASERTVSVAEALTSLGFLSAGNRPPEIEQGVLLRAHESARQSKVAMGGAGDIGLLYAATVLSGTRTAIETGVAYGWSSLAILAGLDTREGALLISVDMPYPKMDNEAFVGVAVPDELRVGWLLVREPDRRGVEKAIEMAGRSVDLVHYDSDKSYQGRAYAYPLLWDALRTGGVFISDDIGDNLAFRDFMAHQRVPFAVTCFEGKHVGIARKHDSSVEFRSK
ncbi:MAG: class I SAM-dependent methyltransferase [Lysobacteraceae bacterium]|nr:MAG: class I SAM-dependent methyltransferase [Xanthomonadaceae bacterium]